MISYRDFLNLLSKLHAIPPYYHKIVIQYYGKEVKHMKDFERYSKKNGMDPMIAGAFTLAGLAMGTAATLYFSKKENRDKAHEKIADLKHKAQDAFESIKAKSEKEKEEMKSKARSFAA